VKLRFITVHCTSSLTHMESRPENQEEINQAGHLLAQWRKANEYAQERLNVVAGRQSCCCQMQTGRNITSISQWFWEYGSSWASQETPTFYETQNVNTLPTTSPLRPYPKPNESSPHLPTFISILILSSHLRSGVTGGFFSRSSRGYCTDSTLLTHPLRSTVWVRIRP
jgi:hypothetical protein